MKFPLIFWRCFFFIVGIFILSIGIVFTIRAPIVGVGSWDVLHIGLKDTVGLTIGMWSIITGVIVIMIDSVVMRRLPRIGTIIDMLAAGILIDVFNIMIPQATTITTQIIMFIIGVLLLSFGSGMYIIGNVGVGPRDTFMLLIVNKVGWSVRKTRTVIEITVAVLGFILGGPIGIGTVIMAVGLGPIIQYCMNICRKLFIQITGVKDSIYS